MLKELNNTGICLALISKEHYRTGHITSRLWEGLAAGTVVITVPDERIKNDFRDNVYYVDPMLSEDELYNKILFIIKEINDNKSLSREKAIKAQNIFKEKYSAEKMAFSMKKAFLKVKDDLLREGNDSFIDIIAYVDSKRSFENIIRNIKAQTYKNKTLYVLCEDKKMINENELQDIAYSIHEVSIENRGEAFSKIRKLLKGDSFVFIDGMTCWQFRFLYKMKRILDSRKLDFVYSGTYYLNKDASGKIVGFDYLTTENITAKDFLSPLKDIYFHEKNYLNFEECFSLGSAMFSNNVLVDSDDIRLSAFYNSPHIYLAVKSLLRNEKSGDFARIYCSGYERFSGEKGYKAIHSDEFYNETGRPGKLTSVAVMNAFVDELELRNNINIDNSKLTDVSVYNSDADYVKINKRLVMLYARMKILQLKIEKIFLFSVKRKAKIKKRIKKLKNILKQ